MRSAGSSTPLNLEADLHTTPEDIEALRRARREAAAVSLEDYLEFLKGVEHFPATTLRARRGPRGDTPFAL